MDTTWSYDATDCDPSLQRETFWKYLGMLECFRVNTNKSFKYVLGHRKWPKQNQTVRFHCICIFARKRVKIPRPGESGAPSAPNEQPHHWKVEFCFILLDHFISRRCPTAAGFWSFALIYHLALANGIMKLNYDILLSCERKQTWFCNIRTYKQIHTPVTLHGEEFGRNHYPDISLLIQTFH